MYGYKMWLIIYLIFQDMFFISYETKCSNLKHLKQFVIMMCRLETLIIILNSSLKT
jgi:hypothetical protein